MVPRCLGADVCPEVSMVPAVERRMLGLKPSSALMGALAGVGRDCSVDRSTSSLRKDLNED
jgi:hypothetical protein